MGIDFTEVFQPYCLGIYEAMFFDGIQGRTRLTVHQNLSIAAAKFRFIRSWAAQQF